jgi:gentisate 1,2-dioxygenase
MLQQAETMMLEADPDDVSAAARYHEYTRAANPIGAGLIPPIPFKTFAASLYADGPTRIVPLDLSREMACTGPATGPGLLASFVRVCKGESISLAPLATSQIFYVIRGAGNLAQGDRRLEFTAGAFVSLPGGLSADLQAEQDLALYYVTDAPLLTYLGVSSVKPRFEATLYPAERAELELQRAANDQHAGSRNRISILLGHRNFPQTATVTHVLWAMFGLLPAHAVQKPHRHQSIALDFIVDCPAGCYSLVGARVNDAGEIINPTRVDWAPGMAFVTPPGYWHAHINESNQAARLIPIQDAGLQTYLRALDIRFTS